MTKPLLFNRFEVMYAVIRVNYCTVEWFSSNSAKDVIDAVQQWRRDYGDSWSGVGYICYFRETRRGYKVATTTKDGKGIYVLPQKRIDLHVLGNMIHQAEGKAPGYLIKAMQSAIN